MINEKVYIAIDNYIKNKLNHDERIAFEELLDNDLEIFDEFIIQKNLYNIIGQKQNKDKASLDKNILTKVEDFFNSEGGILISESIKEAQKVYNKPKIIKFNKRVIISIAASLLLLMVYVFSNNDPSNAELFAKYNDWNDLPSLVSRNENSHNFTVAVEAFETKDYINAEKLFKKLINDNTINPQLLLYLGAIQIEIGYFDDAIVTYNRLLDSNTFDSYKAPWYKALTYLKSDNTPMSISILENLIEDKENYKHTEAIKLLAIIKK